MSIKVHNYSLPKDVLNDYPQPTIFDIKKRTVYRTKYPNADYVAILYQRKMVFVPVWHPLNSTPLISHGADYGSGVFEGLSAEPVIKNGRLSGANIILLKPRMKRLFERSLPSRNLTSVVSTEDFTQSITDLLSIHISHLYLGPQGFRRAYIRPIVRPAYDTGLTVNIPPQVSVDMAIMTFYWPFYLTRDPEAAYHGSGAIVEAFPEQRLQPIEGKNSSSYGPTGPLTAKAKAIDADEAVLFAPFTSKDGQKGEMVNLDQDYLREGRDPTEIMPDLSLADGPGEEIAVVNPERGELWVLPMRVNRLGGTTLQHVQKYIAPKLDLKVVERTFSLRELEEAQRKGEHVCPIFVGNAIKVCPIGTINMRNEKDELKKTYRFTMTEAVRRMQQTYENQVAGLEDSGNPEFLTPVNLVDGNEARRQLDRLYADWFEPEYLAKVEEAMAA